MTLNQFKEQLNENNETFDINAFLDNNKESMSHVGIKNYIDLKDKPRSWIMDSGQLLNYIQYAITKNIHTSSTPWYVVNATFYLWPWMESDPLVTRSSYKGILLALHRAARETKNDMVKFCYCWNSLSYETKNAIKKEFKLGALKYLGKQVN